MPVCLRCFFLLLSSLVIWGAPPGVAAEDGADTMEIFPAIKPVGDPQLKNWTGITFTAGMGTLALPGTAQYVVPPGKHGAYKHGFRVLNDSTQDWRSYAGLCFEAQLPDAREVEIVTELLTLTQSSASHAVRNSVKLQGRGWHTVRLPWSVFDTDRARTSHLKYVQGLSLKMSETSPGATGGSLGIRNVCLYKAPVVALECAVRGKPASATSVATYEVRVSNCTSQSQSIVLSTSPYGWEVMESTIVPPTLSLGAGESALVKFVVKSNPRVPPGGHEEQTLVAIPNGDAGNAARLKFVTTSRLPHPCILHTPVRWTDVRAKIKACDWAAKGRDEYVKKAEQWRVPEIATPPHNDPDDTMGPFLFATTVEHDLMACGVAWQLTRKPEYAEKVALFMRRLSDPQHGYPVTLRGCNQSLVQEGHFFQHIAMAYDMVLDAGVISAAEQAQIETTFRIYIETINRVSDNGPINNWNLSECCGAFYCALVMQDLVTADRFFSGPAGIVDHLTKGTMDDGWWYECSISYNVWCASEFTQAALAYEPFGLGFTHRKFPASYSPQVMLVSELSGGAAWKPQTEDEARKPFGMNPYIFGPTRRPDREIRDLWNSLLPFLDYRGVMFGVNDSTENDVTARRPEVGGQPFELAYYVYRDPAYAALIKQGKSGRDLIYGVPDLPEQTPENFRKNAYADNVGLVMLRSQTPERPAREQLQAVLHYGTHGWAHGHYDRTNLLSLMRYGRSFYNPEMVWFGYEPFMYKFYVQTSVGKNMVIVDQKMQEPTPGRRLLFHSGKAFQATAVEATARWSNPPYGGMVYDYVPAKTFAEKTWREGRFVPIPANPPAYGSLTDYTEPIRQRRAMIVTDDYIVLADHIRGTKKHTYESLLQLKGFQGLAAPEKTLLRHDAQWNPDPVGSAQFITDCNWFRVKAPVRSQWLMNFGQGADLAGTRALYSESGPLTMDVQSLWPPQAEVMIGTVPEEHQTQKRLFYAVRGDGRVLHEGKFGSWILGKDKIDVPLAGIHALELEARTELAKQPTLFWADAYVVLDDNSSMPLSKLSLAKENIVEPPQPGRDYFGGPIKIVGREYHEALATEPKDGGLPARMRVSLDGIKAVRLVAEIGGDYPLGDETARRKTYAVRQSGTEAQFLTLIEPYEQTSRVKRAEATGPDALEVELTDGHVQELIISGLAEESDAIGVVLKETKNGKEVRSEATAPHEGNEIAETAATE